MTREKEMETERMMIYDEIMKKTSLSPLVEVIEPTPPLQRNSPIFMMTSLDMLGISDESEYDTDISDISFNTRRYEDEKCMDTDKTSQNAVTTETLKEGDKELTNKYEMLRLKVESYLDSRDLLKQREGERNKEIKNTKNKLVDNINTFM